MKTKEIPVCGLAAVRALFEKDPDSIKRLFFDYETSRNVPALTRHMAKTKRVYRVLTAEELAKVGATVHHGGIVAVIESKPLGVVTDTQLEAWGRARAPLLLLDRIGNAHNLGAIARTAAFFGVEHLVLPEHPQQALPSESAYRTAEGGLAHLTLWSVQDLAGLCRALAGTHEVVGTAVEPGTRSLSNWRMRSGEPRALRPGTPPRPAEKPVALVLGNEERGLSQEVRLACTTLVRIPGHGERVESLNVSAAAAVLLWEVLGRTREKTGTPPPAPGAVRRPGS